ncbi:MAG: peptidylprolyl isomerase, partial [Candidatus Levyibacteriota bacterium]
IEPMNKFHIGMVFVLIFIFLAIIIITQNGTGGKSATTVPTLPPDASTFRLLTPTVAKRQVAGAQSQQQQQAMPTFGVEEGVQASYSAVIKTSKGDIDVTLDGKDAPREIANFLSKAKSDYYKGLKFHRVEDWVVQGGDPKGDGTGGNLVQTELNEVPFTAGSLGVAGIQNQQGQIISNDSQFFIIKTDAAWLNQKYTNFGQVTNGMNVVNSLQIGDKILDITVSK